MSNITAIATQANALKNVNKKEAHCLLVDLVNNLPTHLIDENDAILSTLYRHFLPATPKQPKTDFDAACLFMAKNDTRDYLNFVYVDENRCLCATDGNALTRINLDSQLDPGFYDKAKNRIELDYKYPDFDRVCVRDTNAPNVDLSAVKSENTVNVFGVQAYRLTIGEREILVQKVYWDKALAAIGNVTTDVSFGTNGAVYVLRDAQEIVIMPLKD